VLVRLAAAELRERNPHLQDDYRISWITVLNAAECVPEPHVVASYAVLGLHPSKVWPAILERRKALLGSLYVDESLPPKKPVESVRFIEESARRVVGEGFSGKQTRREIIEISRRLKRVEGPGMAAPTATAYPNSERAKSGNTVRFSVPDLVQLSTWPAEYRDLLLYMLKFNPFGTELFASQRKAARALGKSYSTVRRMVDRLERGHRFGRKNVVHCEGVLTQTIEPNKRPGGKLRRTATYKLDPYRLRAAPTEKEYEESLVGALCPFPPQSARSEPPSSPSASPAATPVKQDHRSAGRSLTVRQRKELAARIELYERGSTEVRYANGSVGKLKPGDAAYVKPMMREAAILAACQSMARGDPTRGLEAHGVALDKAREAAEEMEGGP
jgi:hypothetical protein